MKTFSEHVQAMADEIRRDAKTLFLQHSSLKRDSGHRGVIVLGGDHFWNELSVEASQLQSKLRDDYLHLSQLIAVLLMSQPSSVRKEDANRAKSITGLIDQQGITYFSSSEEAFGHFEEELSDQLGLLLRLYDSSNGEHVYVPDTNALLYHPSLEEWAFAESRTFVVVLIPTVLSELDKLKSTGKDSLKEKAERIIRQIKEYRRRGNLLEGVPLRSRSHKIQTIATEPDFQQTLKFLDPSVPDDRVLAGFLEVVRKRPRCQVTLVTRDINMINKADFARIPCVEPPELRLA